MYCQNKVPISVGNANFRSAIVLKPNMLRDIKLSPLHQIGFSDTTP